MKQTTCEQQSCIEESILGIKEHYTQGFITALVYLASLSQMHLATKPL